MNILLINPPAEKLDHWEEFLSIKKLSQLQKVAYKKYYLRPFYMIRSLFNNDSIYEFTAKARGLVKLIG